MGSRAKRPVKPTTRRPIKIEMRFGNDMAIIDCHLREHSSTGYFIKFATKRSVDAIHLCHLIEAPDFVYAVGPDPFGGQAR